jgi:chromate transporter
MTGSIAWAYVRYGSLPQVGGVLYGIKPVVIAIVLQALWGLFPKATKKSWWLALLGATACVAAFANIDAIAILLAAGGICAAAHAIANRKARQSVFFMSSIAAGAGSKTSVGLGALFLTFLKAGSLVFGSGYVLLAFLRTDLVERTHWMTESQLVDAIAVGQITPGPVFTSATFIGYLLGGGWGALVATIAIFLPGFVLVAAIRPIVARVRKSPTAGAFLDGVNVASLGLMAVVSAELGRSALVDWQTVLLAAVSLVVLVRWKPNPTWLIVGGAAIGALVKALV